jgi:hypothetical protein
MDDITSHTLLILLPANPKKVAEIPSENHMIFDIPNVHPTVKKSGLFYSDMDFRSLQIGARLAYLHIGR